MLRHKLQIWFLQTNLLCNIPTVSHANTYSGFCLYNMLKLNVFDMKSLVTSKLVTVCTIHSTIPTLLATMDTIGQAIASPTLWVSVTRAAWTINRQVMKHLWQNTAILLWLPEANAVNIVHTHTHMHTHAHTCTHMHPHKYYFMHKDYSLSISLLTITEVD